MSRVSLEAKYAAETISQIFDFASKLAVGETISTSVVTASVYSGTDASPSGVISGTTTNSGTKVTQKLTGGVAGVTYLLVCQITTNAGQTLDLSGYLVILPASA